MHYMNRAQSYYKKTLDYYNKIGNLCGVYSQYPFLIEGFKFEKKLERHFNKIIDLAEIDENLDILEAGCGYGGVLKNLSKLKPNNNYTGITLVPKHLERKQFNNIKVMNYDNTEFIDSSFNRILFIESFSHSFNKFKTLKEAYRLLAPNGIVFILDLSISDSDFLKIRDNIFSRKLYKEHINFFGDKPTNAKYVLHVAKKAGLSLIQFKENLNNKCNIQDNLLNKLLEKIILTPKLNTFYNYYVFKKELNK